MATLDLTRRELQIMRRALGTEQNVVGSAANALGDLRVRDLCDRYVGELLALRVEVNTALRHTSILDDGWLAKRTALQQADPEAPANAAEVRCERLDNGECPTCGVPFAYHPLARTCARTDYEDGAAA